MSDAQVVRVKGKRGGYRANAKGLPRGTEAAKACGRSKISNGRLFERGVDCRSPAARRFRTVVELYSKQLGGNLSQWQLTTVRNIATLTLAMETMDQAAASGKPIDAAEYGRLTNDLSRRLRDLGLVAGRNSPSDDDDDVLSNADGPSLDAHIGASS